MSLFEKTSVIICVIVGILIFFQFLCHVMTDVPDKEEVRNIVREELERSKKKVS